jgi:hypothetical protein
MLGPEKLSGCPIAETESFFEQRLAEPGNCESAQGKRGSEFQQLAAIDLLEFPFIHPDDSPARGDPGRFMGFAAYGKVTGIQGLFENQRAVCDGV